MKLLIIGIDGGTEWIFDWFDMPFWKDLKSRSAVLPAREDVLQRGWAKMLSGLRATQTGGFYMHPRLDGTRNLTPSYGYQNLAVAPGFVPVWRFAENAGLPVGLMNIPTTFPAQKINGFYVSGGGGGLLSGSMPENAVWPSDAESVLKKNNYIFDTRLGKENFHWPKQLCDHLSNMMDARTTSFIDLARQHEIGFGFMVFRAPTVLMYLAMSEIMALVAKGKETSADSSDQNGNSGWGQLLRQHFKMLDQNLRLLMDKLKPDHFMIVSDHSIVPYRYKADLNFFLAQQGFSSFKTDIRGLIKNAGKLLLRPGYRKALSACHGPAHKIKAFLHCNRLNDKSLAFGGYYVHGIYINDERFAGPVRGKHVPELTTEIIERFNQTPQAREHNLKAVPYRENFAGDAYADLAPDIKIEQNWETFFTHDAFTFIRPNENFGPVKSLKGLGGMHSGQKGDRPLMVIDPELASMVRKDDPLDLTLVHHLSRRLFSA